MSLREPFDAAARSVRLATCLATLLPERPRLADITTRDGGMFRWLAPIIGRAQVWTFIESDASQLDEAFEASALWAVNSGFSVTFPGHSRNRAMLVHTPAGAWRVEAFICETLDGDAPALRDADVVVCTDPPVDMRHWLGANVRAALLATLIGNGRDSLRPHHAFDVKFMPSQRLAVSSLMRALMARGFAVHSAPSDWNVPRTALAMLRALIEQPVEQQRGTAVAAWQRLRMRQALAGKLAIRVGHRDILALPPGRE